MSALPTGTVTFFFADVEGSTRLARELGEGWQPVLADLSRHSNSNEADIGNIRALAKRVRASIDQGLQAGGGKDMPAFDAEAAYEIYKETLKKSEELIAGRPKLSVKPPSYR